MPLCGVRRTVTGIFVLYYLLIIAPATQSNWQPEAVKLIFMSPFTYFFDVFLSFKEMQWASFATVLPCKWWEERAVLQCVWSHSVAMKIMYSFLASVSWRPGSADFKVGTMPSEQMGINVSIGYKCYRHDFQFQMLQNVVLNFYLWMHRICSNPAQGRLGFAVLEI